MATYDVALSSIEVPANVKQQYGETKIVTFNENDVNKYSYEDGYMKITWYVTSTTFYFDLVNKSGHAIKINWDDVAYVNIKGATSRVMHAGVKYNEKDKSQPASVVPKNATISELVLPTDNVFYQDGVGWREANLIPSFYQSIDALKKEAPTYVGKKMRILMPIVIENVQNDYIFEFNVEKWTNQNVE
jgi:hypothetical protein